MNPVSIILITFCCFDKIEFFSEKSLGKNKGTEISQPVKPIETVRPVQTVQPFKTVVAGRGKKSKGRR